MRHNDLLEQVMRATGDETAVARLREDLTAGTAPAVAIGRMLADTYVRVTPGSPLHQALGGHGRDPHWRRRSRPQPGSLWEQLELLRGTSEPPSPHSCPYAELLTLRRQWPDPAEAWLQATFEPPRDAAKHDR